MNPEGDASEPRRRVDDNQSIESTRASRGDGINRAIRGAIADDLIRMSAPYGTRVTYDEGTGRISFQG